MYEIECAYRRVEPSGIEFIPDAEIDEARGDFCELRVKFKISAIYPPEPDVGVELDWDGDIGAIEIRTVEFRRWRRLRDEEFVAARAYLLAHHERALWEAGFDHAEAVHLREVA